MSSYTDEQLACAVAQSHSWRQVLRAVGLLSTSAGSMRAVRRRADLLDLDYSHFRGQRRWSDAQLRDAVAASTSWQAVCDTLGVAGGSSRNTLRGHAARLGLDCRHLTPVDPAPDPSAARPEPDLRRLPRAGSMLAAAWFEMCGLSVSWPMEPCRFDLLVWTGSRAERIQVKTTTLRTGTSWRVQLATRRKEQHTYGPDEIDQFFVVDGDLSCYLIPVQVVGGLTAIHLSRYQRFRVRSWTDLASGS